MGPRLFRRGNCDMGGMSAEGYSLQWGHVFSDVETLQASPAVRGYETLQWGHVFSDVETLTGVLLGRPTAALQWGHVFSDVETYLRTPYIV